jgi:hypothetical protein
LKYVTCCRASDANSRRNVFQKDLENTRILQRNLKPLSCILWEKGYKMNTKWEVTPVHSYFSCLKLFNRLSLKSVPMVYSKI